ncbi:hypothetical protein [Acidiphilium acidophilum]|uniref:hypothetical protein n=1 Tax=Acidiphilium acidophilum TaxID=76588 RepID=UPI002E8E7045|nr:hypothetical protein [Acidiphilium acidophilum]
MPWTPTYTPLTLKEKLTFTARKLRETMATRHKLLGIALPLLCLLDARFSSLINRLLDAIAATPGPHRPRSPGPQSEQSQPDSRPESPRESRLPAWLRNWHTPSLGPPPPLPRRFGILRRTFAHYTVNGFIAQIEHLLTTPDMLDAIARNPAIPRILRPLCHLCGIKPPALLALPKRKRQPRPKPAPQPIPAPAPPDLDDRSICYFIPNPANPRNFIPVYPPGSPLRYDTIRKPKKSR